MGPATCNNFHGFLKSKVTRRRLSTGLNWYKKTTYDCTMESNSAIECCQNPEGSSCIETVCANRSNIVLANSRLTLEFARPEQEFGQEFGPQKSAEKSCNCTQYHLYKIFSLLVHMSSLWPKIVTYSLNNQTRTFWLSTETFFWELTKSYMPMMILKKS